MTAAANATLASHLDDREALAISRQLWGHAPLATLHTGDPQERK